MSKPRATYNQSKPEQLIYPEQLINPATYMWMNSKQWLVAFKVYITQSTL